jgi:hypothetical protein
MKIVRCIGGLVKTRAAGQGVLFALVILFGIKVASSCVTTQDSGLKSLSDTPLILATLDLFSQQTPPQNAKPWQGDWEFRRERLELIDRELRELRPDIVFFQNTMRRAGSASEDDSLILKAGALSRYSFESKDFQFIEESGEDRMLSTGVMRPLEFAQSTQAKTDFWRLGSDGAMSIREIEAKQDSALLVNVLMPSQREQASLWYAFVTDRVQDYQKMSGVCPRRLIVGGYLPFEGEQNKVANFLRRLKLKDSAMGNCQNAENCYTGVSTNDIYAKLGNDQGRGQFDKILVNEEADVIAANVTFQNSKESEQFKDIYGLSKIWPSHRFGWTTKVRLKTCP